jgi:hypothetical protein
LITQKNDTSNTTGDKELSPWSSSFIETTCRNTLPLEPMLLVLLHRSEMAVGIVIGPINTREGPVLNLSINKQANRSYACLEK